MIKIAILSSEKHCNKIEEDLLLKDRLISLYNFKVAIIPWKSTELNDYDVILVKSVWGYHNSSDEFFAKLQILKQNGKIIINDVDTMNFLNSKYNQYNTCGKLKIPYIKTCRLEEYRGEFGFPIVVKPDISASGDSTFKINSIDEYNIMLPSLDCYKKDFIVQPYYDGIMNGEYSYVVINGICKNIVKRYPGVFTDLKAVYPLDKTVISDEILKFVDILYKKFGKLAFFRLDIMFNNNKPYIIEIESIDPDLFIRNIENLNEKINVVDELARCVYEKVKEIIK